MQQKRDVIAQRTSSYACVDGTCVTDCASASCAVGYYCRGDLNICMPRCTRVDDPICDGYRCDVTVGECESYCLPGELECTDGYTCDATMHCVAS
ncbi:MAG: hypothetical protein M3619_10125 [Myxococcota bacterium]|nr:hypothetical protein [Myxococcota bacterium]